MEFDLAHRVVSEVGWQWPRFEDDPVLYPYFIHGSAGIASVLVRFHQLLGIERYYDLAHRIATDTLVAFASVPGLFNGLAGIGELMLDLRHATGEALYHRYALDIAGTILLFGVERPGGLAYPGNSLMRISTDYATGSSGIGMFLTRLLRPRPRALLDIDDRRATVPAVLPPLVRSSG